jgi:hypothetical protein
MNNAITYTVHIIEKEAYRPLFIKPKIIINIQIWPAFDIASREKGVFMLSQKLIGS